ncbi:TlpA family protein disulfide reductase [Myroides marinus]|uniref:TlpA family protein disulfide reductase n=1 Tax=Myroides marinus TaxID=703342 RepID=UPI00257547FA|nr:TlpA disulfide reductase family protein [Myroides marinus]MDM1367013.1 TlpA family protein disulfide reductase [Myroides marinus]MDM1381466.1 TlpA family protein disulfide reductase [Myroides marinus]MDM1390171.1 TlpA family protein disulfide reductase [Myroides marinus]MDM1403941.1 TlpA family protein disulfide reductase [Myroides marinus]
MKKIFLALAVFAMTFAACNKKAETTTEEVSTTLPEEVNTTPAVEEQIKDTTVFAQRALEQEFAELDGKSITLQQILEQQKGKAVVIDVWAAWCPDCIKAVPTMKEIKKEFSNVIFVNLSLDKTEEAWKEAIEKYGIEGLQYYSKEGKGMKGDFGKSLDLNWIPRYIVVDKEGKIALYNATEKNFDQIKDLLKKIQ